MKAVDQIIAEIEAAFADVPYPGDWCHSREGNGKPRWLFRHSEPDLVERDFLGKRDWRVLDAKFLDLAPDGFASALAFFSRTSFRFYIPAFMIAELRGLLECATPTFYLTHGLYEPSKSQLINPRSYGNKTWFDDARERFTAFDRDQSLAVIAYLEWAAEAHDGFEREYVEPALDNYWRGKVAGEALPGA